MGVWSGALGRVAATLAGVARVNGRRVARAATGLTGIRNMADIFFALLVTLVSRKSGFFFLKFV